MIVRIVKMTFEPKKVDQFLDLFHATKTKIEAVEGCTHLELLRDVNYSNILFTYSYWEDESFVDKYKETELFKNTWSLTKQYFSGKPEAWSLEKDER